ncbi:ribosomal silencing factor RsfS [Mammaliicoccus sciuri]|uniref:ribosome silencing factor n=1 Tax=Mammaliicoccus sciuri TaxID=1296 RepID=UPI000734EA57|nr:ribosome silencing factor [Mammaliicoccus sciuri]KTT86229.1 ribosomal silencing factor RsfS [Mammaliicoccus sciuri]KTT88115.1 ribosomal silencing factor RsfS [Mammaliicoccus sciuri]KTT91317.1 ribosomal silencing factor RsfS [Mammaliicoccus sciuri]KTT92852.1 ribosomal silencing factor RsfS [Mammaliicoccus sciuri]KTW11858.1 ribosomal silencing factor RsfS [Mammaliicoccus sciuri]
MNSNDLMKQTLLACDDKRAEDIIAIYMKGISDIADYFVVCHGNSDKQVQAIARNVKDEAEINDVLVKRLEGFNEARWVLIDLGDVVVHVFHREERDYYDLERLYKDAPIITLNEVAQ